MVVAEKPSRQHFHAGMQKVGEKNCHFKTLFTGSGGPRSSGVGFFCFVSPERENKRNQRH